MPKKEIDYIKTKIRILKRNIELELKEIETLETINFIVFNKS